jgi:hypothetical protein
MYINRISPNETEVHFNRRLVDDTKRTTFLFSYDTPVAAKVGTTYYKTEEKFSNATSQHLNRWLEGVQYEVQPQSWFDKAILEVHLPIYST